MIVSGISPDSALAGLRFAPQPEAVGMRTERLRRLDTLAAAFIRQRAFPGCAIFVMRRGQVVLHRAYGRHSYDPQSIENQPINTVWDLASVTKVAATTLLTMHLVQEGRMRLTDTLRHFLPDIPPGSNLSRVTIWHLLTHRAGLPHYHSSVFGVQARGEWEPGLDTVRRPGFDIPYRFGYWMRNDLPAKMFRDLCTIATDAPGSYRYSDLSMIYLARACEQACGQRLDNALVTRIYGIMGLTHTVWNPVASGRRDINYPPTEHWNGYAPIQGTPHDPEAANLGGIAGVAGLFANGYDLLKLGQMLLDSGQWRGIQIISPEIITKFTQQARPDNRRALGWDRPGVGGHCGPRPSSRSFGHSGYTGTLWWIDPAQDLVIVLLSNRTMPFNGTTSTAFNALDVRTQVMNAVYDSILK